MGDVRACLEARNDQKLYRPKAICVLAARIASGTAYAGGKASVARKYGGGRLAQDNSDKKTPPDTSDGV
jgi:hypothetical protein